MPGFGSLQRNIREDIDLKYKDDEIVEISLEMAESYGIIPKHPAMTRMWALETCNYDPYLRVLRLPYGFIRNRVDDHYRGVKRRQITEPYASPYGLTKIGWLIRMFFVKRFSKKYKEDMKKLEDL